MQSDPPIESTRILIVDDEPSNLRLLDRLLRSAGYQEITQTTDSRDVLDLYRKVEPDLILLDLMMPYLDGVAVLGQLSTVIPKDVYLPVLVLTADATMAAKRRALDAGAKDFLTKPFQSFELLLRIRNLLETRRLHQVLERENRSLEATAQERTQRLLQSEKVATMGSLLAGVAHELNNPLAALSGHAQLLREGVDDPVVSRRADKINAAAERCVRIVRNFLALARQRPPERSAVCLRQVVDGAVELLAYGLRTDGVEIVVDVPETLPVLSADPHQLHQLLVNLVSNAHHAMRRQDSERRITLSACDERARGRILLEVTDTGAGMPPDVIARIFEPFFTTKPLGEGTGLGLSLCRGIIEEHGGTVTVESEPGRGTRFVIELPVTPAPVTSPTPRVADPQAVVGRKSILIVDDEGEVAAVIAEAFQLDGHATEVARNGAVALELLERATYDLVVSDTKMPVLDGQTLWSEIGRRFPSLSSRMMFLTGDVLSREKREFLEQTGAPFLTKPCDLTDVRALARRVLARPS